MQVHKSLKAVALVLPLQFAVIPARALECPVPHPEAGANAINETPAQIREYSAMLAGGDTGNAVGEIITRLRRKHADATPGEIANFLVTAYCPALEAQGYRGTVATAKINEFSALVDARLFKHD